MKVVTEITLYSYNINLAEIKYIFQSIWINDPMKSIHLLFHCSQRANRILLPTLLVVWLECLGEYIFTWSVTYLHVRQRNNGDHFSIAPVCLQGRTKKFCMFLSLFFITHPSYLFSSNHICPRGDDVNPGKNFVLLPQKRIQRIGII